MTVNTKYSIGNFVWHAKGIYNIPIRLQIREILLRFNEYGKLLIMYNLLGDMDRWWVSEEDLFDTIEQLNESLGKQSENQ